MKLKDRGIRILGIGDVHLAPGYDSKRMKIAGQFAAYYRPHVIVQIGDLGDMPSLNLHRNKIEMEGARYAEDCEAVRDGMADFMRPLYEAKKRLPARIITGGNHENYIRRLVAQDPRLKGHVDLERDLGLDRFGWTYHEYQDRVPVAGFHFAHNISTKSSISADVSSPKWGFVKKGVSMVTGHTHTKVQLQHPMLNMDGTPRKIHGINMACFIHKDMGRQEHWSRNTEYTYDRGLWTFDNAVDGDARITFWRAAEDLGC